MKYVGFGALGLIALIVVVFILNLAGFAQYSFFAPKYTAVQNQVFHESQAYNDGMLRDLENIKREYQQASPQGKQALRATALHRFEIYPRERLTPDLLNFYDSLNN